MDKPKPTKTKLSLPFVPLLFLKLNTICFYLSFALSLPYINPYYQTKLNMEHTKQ